MPIDETMTHLNKKRLSGIGYALMAFSAWGVLPLYWKVLEDIPALEILAHRILWSFVFMSLIILLTGEWHQIKKVISSRRTLIHLFLCGIIISANWLTFIWAVNVGRVVETSLGYYINPLIIILLGMIVFKERLVPLQYLALLFASIGVIIMTIQHGQIPWVALTLAFTFATYGLLKKTSRVESSLGLAMETFFVMPLALSYILLRQFQGTGSLGSLSLTTTLFLLGTGIITAIPLLWFARGTKRVEFSTIGFMQYIAPTITLYLGIFVFQEHFTRVHLLSFSFIWVALMIYSLSLTGQFKKRRTEVVLHRR